MPRYFGYRRRLYGRRRYGRRYRRFYSPYRSWRRFGKTSPGSGVNVTVPQDFVIPLRFIGATAAERKTSRATLVSPMYNVTADNADIPNFGKTGLWQNAMFSTYCRLYDEMKINSVSYTCIVEEPIGGGNTFPVVEIVTAFDKKITTAEVAAVWPNFDRVSGFSSCRKYTAINNSIARFNRSCWATDLQERTSFFDVDPTTWDQVQGGDAAENVTGCQAWYAAGQNVMFFAPGMWVVGRTNGNFAANQTMYVRVQGRVNVTFRNPKLGPVAGVRGGDVRSVESEIAGKSVGGIGELESAFRKLQVSGDLGVDDDVLKKWKEKRLARKRKAMKIRAVLKAMGEEKDDDTLIDPEEEVLPDVDDDLLMDDDDPTQSIKELENKSSS